MAHADGDQFFEFRSKLFNEKGGRGELKIGFFGSVKDEQGNRLTDAVLTVAVDVPTEQGPLRVTYSAFTNEIGRYRTLDATGAVADLLGAPFDIAPDTVSLLDAEKEGYVQTRRLIRGKAGKHPIMEIDFVMRKSD
jgi:hypothetical protein